MLQGFNVTYEIMTEESAAQGCSEEHGFLATNVSLREAFAEVHNTRTSRVDCVHCIEADECPVVSPRWITVYNGMEFETGAYENRSLHIPGHITDSSRRRIARLMGCYGI